jgi:hypothetical protein
LWTLPAFAALSVTLTKSLLSAAVSGALQSPQKLQVEPQRASRTGMGPGDHLLRASANGIAKTRALLPTAVHTVALVQDTPVSVTCPSAGTALGVTDQALPFQCSISGAGVSELPACRLPTAVQESADPQDTARMDRAVVRLDGPANVVPAQVLPFHHLARATPLMSPQLAMQADPVAQDMLMLSTKSSVILGPTTDQRVPFHFSIRPSGPLWPDLVYQPLAKHTLADGQDTPSSWANNAPPAGAAGRDVVQPLPFQMAAAVLAFSPEVSPTAMQNAGDAQDTPCSPDA